MRKSTLLGTASDPDLRRKKVFQPALPKRFENAAWQKALTPNLSPKQRTPVHTRTASYTSAQTRPSEHSIDLSQLPSRLQQLRGEKTQALNDLRRYEELYDTRLSMHARLKTINSLCTGLFSMTSFTIEAISGENTLKDKLESGLQRVRRMLSAGVDKPQRETFITRGSEMGLHKLMFCREVSAVPAIVSVAPGREVTASLAIPGPVYSLKLPKGFTDAKEAVRGLHFTSRSGHLTLTYDSEYRRQFLSVLASIEGVSAPHCSVQVTCKGDEVTLAISEPEMFPQTLRTTVAREKLEVDTLESAAECKVRKLLEVHLAVMESDGHLKLKWSMSAWDLRKRWFRGRIGSSIAALQTHTLTTNETLRTYKAFDALLHEGTVSLSSGTVRVQLHLNEVLGRYRLSAQKGDSVWVLKEEDDRPTFHQMTRLQFTKLRKEGKTLLSSLELRRAISSMFTTH